LLNCLSGWSAHL